MAELREIEVWEVAPVLIGNLFVAGGVWTGFHERRLHAECGRRWARPTWRRRLAAMLGWRRFVHRATAFYWHRLAPLIERERATATRSEPPDH